MIGIYDINSRIRDKNQKANDMINYKNLCLIDESRNKIYKNNIAVKIKNWRGLDPDSNVAFMEAADAFFILLENDESDSNITNTAQYLLSEVKKVRDPVALQKYFKYKFSRMRNIGKQKERLFPKSTTPLTPKPAAPSNAPTTSQPTQQQSQPQNDTPETPSQPDQLAENLQKTFLDRLEVVVECDRIVRNYDTISKRFYLSNIFKEFAANRRSLYDAVYTTAACIASYDLPFKNLYCSTLETCCYELEKNYIPYNIEQVITAVTDYYIFSGGLNESELGDIFSVLNTNRLFGINEHSNVIDYLKDRPKVHYEAKMSASDLTEDYEPDQSKPDQIVGMKIVIDKEERESLKDIINEYKKSASKNEDTVTNAMNIKALVEKICSNYATEIPSHLSHLLDLFRMSFIVFSEKDSIQETQNAISKLVDAVIQCTLPINKIETMIQNLESEKEYLNTRKEKLGNMGKTEKNKYDKYSEFIDKCIDKLKEHIDIVKKQNPDMDLSKLSDEDKIKIETESCKPILNACNIALHIYESTKDSSIEQTIINNIPKLPTKIVESIIDIAKSSPELVSKDALKMGLKIHKHSIIESSIDLNITDIMNIDRINEQMNRLNSITVYSKPNIDNLLNSLSTLQEGCMIPIDKPMIPGKVSYHTLIDTVYTLIDKYCLELQNQWLYYTTSVILSDIEDKLCSNIVPNEIRSDYMSHLERLINKLYNTILDMDNSIKVRKYNTLIDKMKYSIQRLQYINNIHS